MQYHLPPFILIFLLKTNSNSGPHHRQIPFILYSWALFLLPPPLTFLTLCFYLLRPRPGRIMALVSYIFTSFVTAFIASWAGKVTETTDTWLAGLHFWHQFNGAIWNGHSVLRYTKAGLVKVVPSSSKQPCRPPVSINHMHSLYCILDLSNSLTPLSTLLSCSHVQWLFWATADHSQNPHPPNW